MNVVGMDEVGRGCIAGPVVACAVVMPPNFYHPGIKDSKKLSPKKREEMLVIIKQNAISFGIGVICNLVIDEINILNATKEAMHRALSRLNAPYGKLVVDSVKLNNIKGPYIHPNGADNDYIEVAAASIIAKVYRDNLMTYLATIFPNYRWEKNKGYGTQAHIEAIKKYGVNFLHRKSFLKNLI